MVSIRLSCRRGRCFAAGPVGCQGSAYLYFFSQMRTICQDSVYVLTALPTELHRPGRWWDSNPRQINLHNAFAVGAFERGERPAAFAARTGLRVSGIFRWFQDARSLATPLYRTDPKSDDCDCCVRLSAACRGWHAVQDSGFAALPESKPNQGGLGGDSNPDLGLVCCKSLSGAVVGDKARVGFP